ncbi:MAG: hypothetical protein ACRC4W_07365 [Treponemataceae bacterium]
MKFKIFLVLCSILFVVLVGGCADEIGVGGGSGGAMVISTWAAEADDFYYEFRFKSNETFDYSRTYPANNEDIYDPALSGTYVFEDNEIWLDLTHYFQFGKWKPADADFLTVQTSNYDKDKSFEVVQEIEASKGYQPAIQPLVYRKK